MVLLPPPPTTLLPLVPQPPAPVWVHYGILFLLIHVINGIKWPWNECKQIPNNCTFQFSMFPRWRWRMLLLFTVRKQLNFPDTFAFSNMDMNSEWLNLTNNKICVKWNLIFPSVHFYRGAHVRQCTSVIYDPTVALACCIKTLLRMAKRKSPRNRRYSRRLLLKHLRRLGLNEFLFYI